ncbi:MAG TPA: TetR/AcrR family transcriptional regulator [Acidimicrobiales bacterium]|nr:TetR/AcrR family transcriptional regulator [Acidimicrobiales bacterium]
MVTQLQRRRLDRDTVLAAAEGLVDQEGPDALTMTALAGVLGVKASSLYNHVPSLEALRGELQHRAMRELGVLLRNEAMGKTGEGGLRALAHVLRDYGRSHPGRYGLAMTGSLDPDAFRAASTDATAAFAAIIQSYGIEDLSLDFQVSVFSALHGVIVLDTAGFFQGGLDGEHIFEIVLDMVVGSLADAAPDQALAG